MIFKMSGPWGGQGDDNKPNDPWGGKSGGNNRQGSSDVDRIIRENKEQLRNLFGGGGKKSGGGGSSREPKAGGLGIGLIAIVIFVLFALWQSFYQIEQGSLGLKMRFGKYVETLNEGLNFAPWPIYTIEEVDAERRRSEVIGVSGASATINSGLMLTADENIVDIQFEVQWNINDVAAYQYNLVDQRQTIEAVAQSVMREVVAQLPLIPILSVERENIAPKVATLLQASLDQYESGINILAVNLSEAVAPKFVNKETGEVKDAAAAFERVQSAEARRVSIENGAKAQANTMLGNARAEAAKLIGDAEGYRASAINSATGEASRFIAVLEEYKRAPEVTRRRLYLETMEKIYSNTDKVIMGSGASENVVPYLPLNELTRRSTTEGAN